VVGDGVGGWWKVPHLKRLSFRGGLTRLSEECSCKCCFLHRQRGLGGERTLIDDAVRLRQNEPREA
jgi:hypothetical protein